MRKIIAIGMFLSLLYILPAFGTTVEEVYTGLVKDTSGLLPFEEMIFANMDVLLLIALVVALVLELRPRRRHEDTAQ